MQLSLEGSPVRSFANAAKSGDAANAVETLAILQMGVGCDIGHQIHIR